MKNVFFIFGIFVSMFMASCRISGKLVAVTANDAPKAIGPYSQAVKTGGMIFTAGQIGLSPATNALAGDDISSQTHQALRNIQAVLAASGSDMAHVVKATVYLKDLNDFSKMNDVYKEYFPELKPARTTVQVARLPKDALVEIECVAVSK